MENSLADLPFDCLLHIFSFLLGEELNEAASVCKAWHRAAETPWLWREMCLQRWGFCNVAQFLSTIKKKSWKAYYLRRSQLERNMESSADYTCQTLRAHAGSIVGFVYLSGSDALSEFWNHRSVVCSASSDGTLRAWDIQQAVQLWSSPAQAPLRAVTVDPENKVVITSDDVGTVRAWEGLTGQEVASFSSGSPRNLLHSYNIGGSSYLAIGTGSGSLHTLTSPALSKLSSCVVFDSFSLNIIHSSPDKKWIFTGSKDNVDLSPEVFLIQTLCSSEERAVSTRLPVSGCTAAAFLPSHPARVAVVHGDGSSQSKTLSVFDVVMKRARYDDEPSVQQVETFKLALNRFQSDIFLEAKGSNTLVLAVGDELKVYTVKGALVASFKEHQQHITSLCVDSFRVVTASRDLSLRVLTWRNDGEKGLTLESRYHLLGGSHTMSRGFSHVACDYASIVGSVESVNGKDALKAYTFNS
ncbi:F-box/WD repeat-containing protein 12 [Denticeps clupeoides]|uniref:F-box domain-containing protein n=1 Tax=Denticeps clupeoides TaxID=299321 RepID=A0AAY4B7N9_9TELE|nr:F-box/WD repeat-containing protein 12 [Denticeps clupeoides]